MRTITLTAIGGTSSWVVDRDCQLVGVALVTAVALKGACLSADPSLTYNSLIAGNVGVVLDVIYACTSTAGTGPVPVKIPLLGGSTLYLNTNGVLALIMYLEDDVVSAE